MAPLKNIYDKGHLGFIHAAGSPDNTRSHFDAQDYMEIGTPGIKSTADGWLNRALLQNKKNPIALSRHRRHARNCRACWPAASPALTLSSIEEFRFRNEALGKALGRNSTPIPRTASSASAPRISLAPWPSSNGSTAKSRSRANAIPAGRFGVGLAQIARLIKADVGLEVAFTEIGGWDTHANEGGATGQLANRLRELAEGLAAFYRDLGDRMDDVVLLTMSEFGRTARENGNRGTDHGHANVMFAMGGRVRGGKVYGRWPGLAPEALNEGRDLALTTDFRAVCSEVLHAILARKI